MDSWTINDVGTARLFCFYTGLFFEILLSFYEDLEAYPMRLLG